MFLSWVIYYTKLSEGMTSTYRTGTYITRRLLCICKASTDFIIGNEACIVLGTVAVLQVDGRYRQVV